MTRKVYFETHPDDLFLSMALSAYDALVLGMEVHVVAMTHGAVSAESIRLDGAVACNWCGYKHNPELEGYTVPTLEEIGQLRLAEARATLNQMCANAGAGSVTYHCADGTDPDEPPMFLDSQGGTPEGDALALARVKYFVDKFTNTFFYTMSYVDKHPTHATCGKALKTLRESNELSTWSGGLTYAQALVNSRFFISRLYWLDPSIVIDGVAQVPGLSWYNAGDRYTANCAALRKNCQRQYQAFNPSLGAFAIGYHQVVNQFLSNFAEGVSIGNKMHA